MNLVSSENSMVPAIFMICSFGNRRNRCRISFLLTECRGLKPRQVPYLLVFLSARAARQSFELSFNGGMALKKAAMRSGVLRCEDGTCRRVTTVEKI